MKRRYRVRDNKRFQEIRRRGRSYSDALLVLCALPNDLPYSRFGFSVSSRIGNAVARNRIKRRLREAVRLRMDSVKPGWDVVFIARNPIRSADYQAMDAACARLLRRAHLLRDSDTGVTSTAEGEKDPRAGTPARADQGKTAQEAAKIQDKTPCSASS
ncbi:ribonuclease P protein component [Litorilinea aerophila]|uniref:ribonuclease P protein component n=1 Tax=Litorilinea aerophila TaxID=1204385 RepID=UPI0014768D73